MQRFGSSLNLNVHLHVVVLDGVFVRDEGGSAIFHSAPPPSKYELDAVLARVHRRVFAWLGRHRYVNTSPLEALSDETPSPTPLEACFNGPTKAEDVRYVPILEPTRVGGHPKSMREPEKFLVTGITGNVGGATARGLLAKGKEVRALVRDPKKAAAWAAKGVELVLGDWNDTASIAVALRGVEGAYIMMPPTQTPSPGYPEAKAVATSYAEALAKSPPPKVVALSSFGAEKATGLGLITPPRLLEQALDAVPFPLALVRAGGFFENYLYGLEAAQGGTLPQFFAPTDRKVGHIATADIGALVVELLTTEWSGRRVIELGRPVSPDEIADALGHVLGRDVKALGLPREAWAEAIERMGLPKGRTWAYEEMLEGVNSGWIDFGVDGTEKRPGTTTAREVFSEAKRS